MIMLWFGFGALIIRIKIENKDIFIASSNKGIDNFFKVNTKEVGKFFNEDEKKEFDSLKNEKEVSETIKKELMERGFRFMREG